MEREVALGRVYKHYSGEYYVVTDVSNGLVTYRSLNTETDSTEKVFQSSIVVFLASKVPEGYTDTKQEYCFERADVIHKVPNIKLELAVIKNNGYCPCAVNKNDDTKCMCKDFRESMKDGTCHCGLYKKTWLGDQM